MQLSSVMFAVCIYQPPSIVFCVGEHQIAISARTLTNKTWNDSPNPNTPEQADVMFSAFYDAWDGLQECKKAWFQAFLTFVIATGRTAWESPHVAKAAQHVFGNALSNDIYNEIAIAICVNFPHLENTQPRDDINLICCNWNEHVSTTDQGLKAAEQAPM